MSKILLSKNKINELKKEKDKLEKAVQKFNEDENDNLWYSFRDAAAHDVQIKSRKKRLDNIKQILKNAKPISDQVNTDRVTIGCTVKLKLKSKVIKYKIVHPIEANPTEGLVSIKSALGGKLKEKKSGEEFEFNNNKYKIIQIS